MKQKRPRSIETCDTVYSKNISEIKLPSIILSLLLYCLQLYSIYVHMFEVPKGFSGWTIFIGSNFTMQYTSTRKTVKVCIAVSPSKGRKKATISCLWSLVLEIKELFRLLSTILWRRLLDTWINIPMCLHWFGLDTKNSAITLEEFFLVKAINFIINPLMCSNIK
jgi:hypothetical protein